MARIAGSTELEAIPIIIGDPPFYGRTKWEALDKARDAAMSHMHGEHWRSRPESIDIDLSWSNS